MPRRTGLALVVSFIAAVAFVACGPPGASSFLPEDANEGDTIEDGDGKADGCTVPQSLALDRNGKIYLTFDDGPSRYTPGILDVLARHNAKATFFQVGSALAASDSAREMSRRVLREGHIVGAHNWVHESATGMSLNTLRTYATKTRDFIAEIAAEEGVQNPLYFRFPYGATTSSRDGVLKELGYKDGGIGWDIDTLDWDFNSDNYSGRVTNSAYKRDFVGWILYQAKRRGGGVMLMHDIQRITSEQLDTILTELEQAGFSFASLPRGEGEEPGSTPAARPFFVEGQPSSPKWETRTQYSPHDGSYWAMDPDNCDGSYVAYSFPLVAGSYRLQSLFPTSEASWRGPANHRIFITDGDQRSESTVAVEQRGGAASPADLGAFELSRDVQVEVWVECSTVTWAVSDALKVIPE